MKLLKKSLILSLPFSFILGCGRAGPAVQVCISSPSTNEFRCFDYQEQMTVVMKFEDTENYVCFSPEDGKTLLNYCKNQKNKK